MRISRTIMVHAYVTHDEFTELIREYEKIYGHAAQEKPPVTNDVIRQFSIDGGTDEVTLFHARSFNEQS